jgi:hypothetical protein
MFASTVVKSLSNDYQPIFFDQCPVSKELNLRNIKLPGQNRNNITDYIKT